MRSLITRMKRIQSVALIGAAGAVILTLGVAYAATTVITPTSMGSWTIQHSGTASGALVTGPATPPIGSGSVHLAVGSDGNSGVQIRNTSFSGTKLSDLTALTYSTYVHANSGCQAPYIILDVDNDHNGTVDDLLFFEPCYQNGSYSGATVPNQGNVTLNSWQSWNALTGGWWTLSSGSGGPPLTTLSQYIASHSGATIVNDGSGGGLRIVAGFGAPSWNNFDGNADNLTIGVKGTNSTYDFEANHITSSCDPYAGSVINYTAGTRKDGNSIAPSRTDPGKALGSPDSGTGVDFVSLGFSGSIVLKMNNPITNGPGPDVRIYESTVATNYPLEKANVYASQDGSGWTLIGTADNSQGCDCTKNITDLDLGSLASAQYIKLVDTTSKPIHANDADGFDLNAIQSLNNSCIVPTNSSSSSTLSSTSSQSNTSSVSSSSLSSSSNASSLSSSLPSSSTSSLSSSLSSSSVSSSSSNMCTNGAPTTGGLVGYWKFDEGTGSTTADASGNGHTGMLENSPMWTSSGATEISPNPHALSFNGMNQQVRVAGSGSAFAFGSGSFTVSAFVKTSTGNTAVLGNFSNSQKGWGLYLYGNGAVNFFAYGTQGANDTSFASNVLNNQWHNVAGVFTRSGSTVTIQTYVDGNLIGTHSATVGDITSNSDLLFGHYLLQPYFDGSLDDVRVYNRALSAADIASINANCNAASSSSSSVSSSSLSSSVSSASSSSSLSSNSSSSQSSLSSSSLMSSSSSSVIVSGIPTCGGQVATIYVNAQGKVVGGPDDGMFYTGILRGTSHNDVMVGTNGNDMILGRSGDDVICGGGGNDFIIGGQGNNKIAGEAGNDYIAGGNNDILCGGPGNDVIFGEMGNDKLDGGGGRDMLFGGPGQDVCAEGQTDLSCETVQSAPLPDCAGMVSGMSGVSPTSSQSSTSSMASTNPSSSSVPSSSSSISSQSSLSSSSAVNSLSSLASSASSLSSLSSTASNASSSSLSSMQSSTSSASSSSSVSS